MWDEEVVARVADVLGHTATDQGTGLTGRRIGELLAAVNVPDIAPGITKRDRLREALLARQRHDRASNCVSAFVVKAMAPVRYTDDPAGFSRRRDALNEVLVFQGLRLDDDGRLHAGASASTLDEAARHANSLRSELRRRGTHEQVLAYCTIELLQKNAFHAGLEATKGLAQRLRDLTGATGDGAKVVDAVLALGKSGTPVLAINDLSTDTERDEQSGFANLVKGLFGLYRNPVAHDPRARRNVTDDELLELLTTLSMAHRRLDAARLSI
jgi:uncharacterized protein (TIGR02391 family)